MNTALNDYFEAHLNQLLTGTRMPLATNSVGPWRGSGVYLIWEEGTPVFVETTEDIVPEFRALRTDADHPLRAALRTYRMAELPAFRRRGSPDRELERLLLDNFECTFVAVEAGRLEVRERLVRRVAPRYNCLERGRLDAHE